MEETRIQLQVKSRGRGRREVGSSSRMGTFCQYLKIADQLTSSASISVGMDLFVGHFAESDLEFLCTMDSVTSRSHS